MPLCWLQLHTAFNAKTALYLHPELLFSVFSLVQTSAYNYITMLTYVALLQDHP
jgi:hypothetical protein